MIEEYPSDTEAEDQAEEQAAEQQEYYEDTTPPPHVDKDDLYTLFWKTIGVKDSSKVGYLTGEELGMLPISVRDCQRIAVLADELGHPGFANYFKWQAQIILKTSASRGGWFTELFVSHKATRTKRKEDIVLATPPPAPRKKKFRLF